MESALIVAISVTLLGVQSKEFFVMNKSFHLYSKENVHPLIIRELINLNWKVNPFFIKKYFNPIQLIDCTTICQLYLFALNTACTLVHFVLTILFESTILFILKVFHSY